MPTILKRDRAFSGQSRIPKDFFTRPTLQVARELLGMKLSTISRQGAVTSGMIVEVEAYGGETPDPACHAHNRRTERNEVMFWEGGHCYVYLIYGLHHCVNVVTEGLDRGAAVLIRAIEPLEGIETMTRRRRTAKARDLTSGPGRLCEALAIDRSLCGEHFARSSRIRLEPHARFAPHEIASSPRIGITKAAEYEWRFYVTGNPWVSGS